MKTKDYLFVLGAVIAVHGVGAQNVADFFENGQGSGTPEDPYVITTADQLNAMRYGGENKCYRLDADIDLGTWIAENENVDIREHGWVSIDVFRQILDGNGHKIEGFWQNRETDGGLFFQLQVENVDSRRKAEDQRFRVMESLERPAQSEALNTSHVYGGSAPVRNWQGFRIRIKACTQTEVLFWGSGVGLRKRRMRADKAR